MYFIIPFLPAHIVPASVYPQPIPGQHAVENKNSLIIGGLRKLNQPAHWQHRFQIQYMQQMEYITDTAVKFGKENKIQPLKIYPL